MNNKLLWVIGIVVVAAIGFAVVNNQRSSDESMMKKDTMMESTGTTGDTVREEDKMMESTGASGAMMEPTGSESMMKNEDAMMEK